MKPLFALLAASCCLLMLSIQPCSGATEIWSPSALKQLLENNTRLVGEYISGYYGRAQKQTREIKREISNFIDEKTDFVGEYLAKAKNVTESIFSSKKNDSDCEYDPDVDLSTPQIVTRHGYPAETHFAQTQDGYILALHRIPRGRNKAYTPGKRQPILLHHGLLASSSDWIMSGPDKALAYLLADAGYDVWMGNVRGNTYSRAHVNISSDSRAFWNFSFHEVGCYDLPAYIEYIEEVTETSGELLYVGHSMGTTVMFVLLSERPEYNGRIKAAFALAPVAYMTAIRSPIKLLAPYASDIELVSKFLGAGEFLPQSFIIKWLARWGCELNSVERKLCENSLFVLCGFDEKQFDGKLMPMILGHTPAGASTKTLVHYAQEIRDAGKFQRFDYGREGNLRMYGSENPPEYNVSKITTPIGLFVAKNDWLSGVPDASSLYRNLGNPLELYEVTFEEFNHLDFMWGVDAPSLVYRRLFELLDKYKPEKREMMRWSVSTNGFKFTFE